jgi:hypothetical protein
MKPIEFEEANRKLLPPSGHETNELTIDPLHVWADNQRCVSCWRPSWKERLSILFFGKVWLDVLSPGTQPPVSVSGQKEYFVDI